MPFHEREKSYLENQQERHHAEMVGAIPESLKTTPHWVVWRFEKRRGKTTKVPYNALTGAAASTTDPSTWTDFHEVERVMGKYSGIGFVFSEDDPHTGIDLDKCRNPETGAIESWAFDIVKDLNSYTELSPSGKGLHVLVLGNKPVGRNRTGRIEIYSTARYFTVTGNHLEGTPATIETRSAELAELQARLFPCSDSKQLPRREISREEVGTVGLSDEEIIRKAGCGVQCQKFRLLWGGDTSNYGGDHSAADLALCNLLAFHTQRPDQIDRLFRQSSLMREKWEREDYRNSTVNRAIRDIAKPFASTVSEQSPDKASEASMATGIDPELLSQQHNDHGNSQRLIALFGDRLRYCHELKKWLFFNGSKWVADKTEQTRKFAKLAMVAFFQQAMKSGNEQAQTFARRSLEDSRISSMLAMVRPELYVKVEQLDTDPYLVNFKNGTLDIRTGQLRAHRREDFTTKEIRHDYIAGTQPSRWLRFLDRVMGGGPDATPGELERAERLTHYLQLAVGYSLTGITSEKAVFLCHGGGDNGKSTFLSTIREVANEYATMLQIDTLMTKQADNNSQADLADLRGARFVTTSETEEGQRLAEGKLKRITQGMGKIKAIKKYEDWIEFAETHKLWMDCNHLPIISSGGKAIWNRLRVVPFTVTIPREEIDPSLPAKLMAEAEGILAWIMAGAIEWHRLGRLPIPPEEVTQARAEYQEQMDPLKDWIEQCCIVENGLKTGSSSLYQSYREFAGANGERKIFDNRQFKTALLAKSFTAKQTNKGVIWHGIGIGIERR